MSEAAKTSDREIEVTPEMIEAGVRVLLDGGVSGEPSSLRAAVKSILGYLASPAPRNGELLNRPEPASAPTVAGNKPALRHEALYLVLREVRVPKEILAVAEQIAAESDVPGIERSSLEYLVKAVVFLDRQARDRA